MSHPFEGRTVAHSSVMAYWSTPESTLPSMDISRHYSTLLRLRTRPGHQSGVLSKLCLLLMSPLAGFHRTVPLGRIQIERWLSSRKRYGWRRRCQWDWFNKYEYARKSVYCRRATCGHCCAGIGTVRYVNIHQLQPLLTFSYTNLV